MKALRSLVNMSTKHIRIAQLAKEDKGRKFFSIAHFLTQNALYEAFRSLRKYATAGVDGVTYKEYEADVRGNIQRLHARLKKGQYRAEPLRRVYIPKEDGRRRPISIPTVSAYCTSYNTISEYSRLSFRIFEERRTHSRSSFSFAEQSVIQ
jgi:retron-type reverse transcriptase